MNAITVISTDLLTPLGAYLRLRQGGRASFLLESVEQGRLGRHSFVGCGSRLVSFEEAEACGQPVVGYLGYEHAAGLEPTVPVPDEGRELPESRFVVAEMLVRFDHGLGMAEVLCGDPDAVAELLDGPQPSAAPASRPRSGSTRRLPSRHQYERAVEKAKEHIRAGDAFQVVLSQRAERPTSASALELYRSLRRVNPSPYLFLLELDGLALVGSSPETLVKAEGRRASLNPIAGTTRPGDGDAERLLSSEKDRAEHVMLVDLGRNDLSRACRPGTVRVARFLEPERFSHVTHLVSEVVGELEPEVSHFDLLRACFPAGTVSGAPKVRAMQLIAELERHRRGPYAGAVLYALPGEALDACIAIRTVVLHDGLALLQAGAGIVADSDPAAEHDECLRKLAALEVAIELAEARSSSASSTAAGGAEPEGTVLGRTGPESSAPPAASGGGGAGLRPASADGGEGAGAE
jgi:anthranilate synthase component I